NTRITFRGDGHYARPEAMAWCETNGIDYIFGLSGTKPLARKVDEVADDIRTRRAIENLPVLRGYTETRHKAKSWDRERRTVARIEATMLGLTVRDAIPKARELAAAEFARLRLRLLKIAARVVETTSRIRLAFAAACPEADLICGLPGALLPLGP
ncbi:transposase, partial [Bradyrhizobium liaoningense]|uniref:transposase n=1 Tax=Bradyrhizobium liaoningense TaxID=43992 RepID=UPI0024E0C3FA